MTDDICFQQTDIKTLEEKEEALRLFALERAKQQASMVIKELKKDILDVTLVAPEDDGAVATSLQQIVKAIGGLWKEKEVAPYSSAIYCESMERVEYKRDESQAKLLLAQCEWEKYVDAINCVQSGFGELQVYVWKCASVLKKQTVDHWFRMRVIGAAFLLSVF